MKLTYFLWVKSNAVNLYFLFLDAEHLYKSPCLSGVCVLYVSFVKWKFYDFLNICTKCLWLILNQNQNIFKLISNLNIWRGGDRHRDIQILDTFLIYIMFQSRLIIWLLRTESSASIGRLYLVLSHFSINFYNYNYNSIIFKNILTFPFFDEFLWYYCQLNKKPSFYWDTLYNMQNKIMLQN